MTKVKIFMNHVQVLSLLRDYDLLWPRATFEALGWADALNIGVSVAAPECFVRGFGFWHYYVFSEAAPVAAIVRVRVLLRTGGEDEGREEGGGAGESRGRLCR